MNTETEEIKIVMKKYCTVFLISKNCYLHLLVDIWSKNSYGKPRQHIKKQTHHFARKGPFSQSYGLRSSHVQVWQLDHRKGQEPKNWCFPIVLEKTLERSLDSKKIKPVNPRGNQLWIFIGRTDAEAPILRPLDLKSWLIGKDPDSGKDWGQEERETTEDAMVGWYRRLNVHEFEQTLGDSEGQESLACWNPWGPKEPDAI